MKDMPEYPVSMAALIARFIVSFGLMGLCLFAAAGTLAWPQAWGYLAVQFASSLAMSIWMWRHDPALLASRMSLFKPGMQARDRLFMGGLTMLIVPVLLLPGLDAVRFGWSDVPRWLEVAGLAGIAVSMWLMLRVMQVNSFASPVIEVQKDRGHKVIDSGPYAVVRHPMYSGACAYMLCLPLALGSWWMLLAAVPVIGMFMVRIPMEEQTLHAGLRGYTAYCERVRFRLLPGIW